MDVPSRPDDDDVLAAPQRARLFAALTELRRPASTQELADRVGRHANTTRVQLERLASAGLVQRRDEPQARGRPRHTWAVVASARPAGRAPQAMTQLSTWLAWAIGRGIALTDVESAGREIGRGLAPEGDAQRPLAPALHDALAALGFAPRDASGSPGQACFVLGNCPYREAVVLNPEVVCSLHRGITEGMLERLDRAARLTRFVPKDPFDAGCLVDVALAGAS